MASITVSYVSTVLTQDQQSGTGYVALPSESADLDGRPQSPSPSPSPSTQPRALSVLKPHHDILYTTPRGGSLRLIDEHSYVYAYGPGGLTGLLHNSFALRAAVFASIGGLLFGYDQGVVANILVMKDFLDRWPITPLEKGLMSA